MEWTEKVILVTALNNGEYKEAVNIMLRNENCIDDQAMQMFANGFSVLQPKLLKPIQHIFNRYKRRSTGDNRADWRIALMIEDLENTKFDKIRRRRKRK